LSDKKPFIVLLIPEALQYFHTGQRDHNQVKCAGMPEVDGIPTITAQQAAAPPIAAQSPFLQNVSSSLIVELLETEMKNRSRTLFSLHHTQYKVFSAKTEPILHLLAPQLTRFHATKIGKMIGNFYGLFLIKSYSQRESAIT